MTPLYSKETAEDYIDAANVSEKTRDRHPYGKICAINRLIQNGNEVMEYLEKMREFFIRANLRLCELEVSMMIKKIKGEG